MKRSFKNLAMCLALGGVMMASSLAMATSAAKTDTKKSDWTEIMPRPTNTDAAATAIALQVLAEDIKNYYNDGKTPVSAKFFNAKGLEKDSVLIVTFVSESTCGTMGCATYLLKRGKNNAWHVMDDTLVNSIVTSDALLLRQPAFYTKGTGNAPYRRFNAATERYEK